MTAPEHTAHVKRTSSPAATTRWANPTLTARLSKRLSRSAGIRSCGGWAYQHSQGKF